MDNHDRHIAFTKEIYYLHVFIIFINRLEVQ